MKWQADIYSNEGIFEATIIVDSEYDCIDGKPVKTGDDVYKYLRKHIYDPETHYSVVIKKCEYTA